MALGDYTKTVWVTGDIITAVLFNNVEDKVDELDTWADGHDDNTSNPHSVTKTQVSLGNVDNVQQASLSSFADYQEYIAFMNVRDTRRLV